MNNIHNRKKVKIEEDKELGQECGRQESRRRNKGKEPPPPGSSHSRDSTTEIKMTLSITSMVNHSQIKA